MATHLLRAEGAATGAPQRDEAHARAKRSPWRARAHSDGGVGTLARGAATAQPHNTRTSNDSLSLSSSASSMLPCSGLAGVSGPRVRCGGARRGCGAEAAPVTPRVRACVRRCVRAAAHPHPRTVSSYTLRLPASLKNEWAHESAWNLVVACASPAFLSGCCTQTTGARGRACRRQGVRASTHAGTGRRRLRSCTARAPSRAPPLPVAVARGSPTAAPF
jgi:hypothetical protein